MLPAYWLLAQAARERDRSPDNVGTKTGGQSDSLRANAESLETQGNQLVRLVGSEPMDRNAVLAQIGRMIDALVELEKGIRGADPPGGLGECP